MKTTFAPWATAAQPESLTVCSDDGVLALSLQRTACGVFVQRALQRNGSTRVVQATMFRNVQEFRRWCQSDAARFDYPLLSARLIRHADELFTDRDSETGTC